MNYIPGLEYPKIDIKEDVEIDNLEFRKRINIPVYADIG